MADISQSSDFARTVFTANNRVADAWMRSNFDRYTLQFDLPEEQAEALQFAQAAIDAGLTIGVL